MHDWNREPLAPNAYARRPVGSVRARGWLHEQLRLSAEGLSGHLADIWPGPSVPEPRLISLRRTWHDGDTVVLELPFAIRLSRWEHGSAGVERGPLVYALRIGEEWRAVGGQDPFFDYELHPTTPWNYGLVVNPAAHVQLERQPLGAQPWAQDGASGRLVAAGQRIPQWTVVGGVSGPIPASPVRRPAVLPSA